MFIKITDRNNKFNVINTDYICNIGIGDIAIIEFGIVIDSHNGRLGAPYRMAVNRDVAENIIKLIQQNNEKDFFDLSGTI